ncbi:MAG: hypothetical protein ABEJ88_01570 [Halobacterium sp.]
MSSSRDTRDFASLFVELTGRDTITDPQDGGDARRVDDPDVAADLADAARHTGLDDAIEAPDQSVDF